MKPCSFITYEFVFQDLLDRKGTNISEIRIRIVRKFSFLPMKFYNRISSTMGQKSNRKFSICSWHMYIRRLSCNDDLFRINKRLVPTSMVIVYKKNKEGSVDDNTILSLEIKTLFQMKLSAESIWFQWIVTSGQ